MCIYGDIHTEADPPQKAPLRYHETLDAFSDVISMHYYECEIDVYRTTVNNPPTEFDITPRRRRFESTQGQVLPFTYTQEEIDLMNEEEKKKEIGHDAISVHLSEEKEIKEAKRAVVSFGKKHTAEETEDYKYNQRGTYVMKLHVTPDKALVSKKFHSGHGNLLLREGVTVKDLLDKDYVIKEFQYDDNDNEQ